LAPLAQTPHALGHTPEPLARRAPFPVTRPHALNEPAFARPRSRRKRMMPRTDRRKTSTKAPSKFDFSAGTPRSGRPKVTHASSDAASWMR
jgi:hypothetical protein